MKLKKILASFLVATLIFSSGMVFAASEDVIDENATEENLPITEEIGKLRRVQYRGFTGTIDEIQDHWSIEGAKFVSLENTKGQPANVIISKDTYIFEDAKIAIGDTITAYYDATKPMIMIYPPQYSAEVVVIEKESRNVKFDVFDEDLISSDNFLKLSIDEDTKIILQDGTDYEGQIENLKLLVVYGVSTKSIPAQTIPDTVIVFGEKADEYTPIYDISKMEYLVENQLIDAPPAYATDHDFPMVPLRAIAEALGYEVTWINETRSVMLNDEISLTIGESSYNITSKDPVFLEYAPELTNGYTYVPLNFFREVIKMNNAYVFEEQIVIDNEEKME